MKGSADGDTRRLGKFAQSPGEFSSLARSRLGSQYPGNAQCKGSPEGRFKGEGKKRDKFQSHLPAVRTGTMYTEKCSRSAR